MIQPLSGRISSTQHHSVIHNRSMEFDFCFQVATIPHMTSSTMFLSIQQFFLYRFSLCPKCFLIKLIRWEVFPIKFGTALHVKLARVEMWSLNSTVKLSRNI